MAVKSKNSKEKDVNIVLLIVKVILGLSLIMAMAQFIFLFIPGFLAGTGLWYYLKDLIKLPLWVYQVFGVIAAWGYLILNAHLTLRRESKSKSK